MRRGGDVTFCDPGLAQLERLLGPLGLGILVTGVDLAEPGPTILYANRAMLELTGYSEAELVGATPWILQGPRTERAVLDRLRESLRHGRGFEGETYNCRKDGSECILEWRVSPILGGSGEVAAWLAMLRDVTERRRDRAARLDSEERFRQFAEASSDALWIRSAATLELEHVSSAFRTVFGEGEAGLIGAGFERWLELVLPEDRPRIAENFHRAERGEQVQGEYRVRRPDGEVRWIHGTAFPLRDEAGQVRRIGGIARDVTELRESTGRMGDLVAELQHRTRNLMAVIRSMSERTLQSARSLDHFGEVFGGRLAALARVQGLLSRLQEHDRVAFDELIRAELAVHAAAGRATLQGPAGLRLRSGMVQPLAMALHELAANAARYGALRQPGGHLDVAWEMVGEASGERRLRIDWRESGVPGAALPGTGEGREFIERGLPYQTGAATSLEPGPDGIRCSIEIPVSAA